MPEFIIVGQKGWQWLPWNQKTGPRNILFRNTWFFLIMIQGSENGARKRFWIFSEANKNLPKRKRSSKLMFNISFSHIRNFICPLRKISYNSLCKIPFIHFYSSYLFFRTIVHHPFGIFCFRIIFLSIKRFNVIAAYCSFGLTSFRLIVHLELIHLAVIWE